MRISEYRAWDKKDRIFTLVELGMTFGIECIKNKVFTQFSGVKDKKKKKIYEGDIILIRTWLGLIKTKVVVVFNNGAFRAGYFGEVISNYCDIEKIGNKFENASLLWGKK